MNDPFVAEICMFPFNFAPTGWAFCNGQLMPLSQNTALFALLGTTYGGDGKTTFALPNLMDAVPLGAGQGQGLTMWDLGASSGSDHITLLQSEIPAHTHTFRASAITADSPLPQNVYVATPTSDNIYRAGSPNVTMAPEMLAPAGGSLPHNNLMHYLTINYCIALQGVFPQRP